MKGTVNITSLLGTHKGDYITGVFTPVFNQLEPGHPVYSGTLSLIVD